MHALILGLLCVLPGWLPCVLSSTINQNGYSQGSVAWLVQVSDVHINKYVHHEIVPDLLQFSSQVVALVKPGAIVVTGDLVDSKTRAEGSHQNEEEWKAYETVWRQMAQSAGLPANAILDLRGNHDAFDTMRNTGQDNFAIYSATAAAHGQAAAAAQRVWAHELQPQLLLPPPHHRQQQHLWQHAQDSKPGHRRMTADVRNKPGNSGSRTVRTVRAVAQHHNLTNIKQQPGQQRTTASKVTSRKLEAVHATPAAAVAAASCPAAVLLGLDFTPNVGLHAPANFFGVASVELIQQVQQQLEAIRGSSSGDSSKTATEHGGERSSGIASMSLCRRSLPIISYSHYPFSTVAASYATSSSIRQQRQQQREGGRAVRDLLMRHDVSAHLSGHLHDLVGQRLHAMFSKTLSNYFDIPTGGGGGGGVLGGPASYFADLETADWKQARRWLLLLVDCGVISFADLTFKRTDCTSSSSSSGCISSSTSGDDSSSTGYSYAVTSVDASRTVGHHLAVLTWPPDGRYSPLSSAAAQQQQLWWQQRDDQPTDELMLPVRVWVTSLSVEQDTGSSSSSSGSDIADVVLQYSCQRYIVGLGIHSTHDMGIRRMHPIGRSAAASSSGSSIKPGYPYRLTGPQVFGTRIRLDPQQLLRECGDSSSSSVVLQLQVRVTNGTGSLSTSEVRHVLLPRAVDWQQHMQQGKDPAAAAAAAATAVTPLSLGNGLFEWLIIVFDGPAFGYWLFYTGWMCQVIGLLLLPRLFGRYIIKANAVLWKPAVASSSCTFSASPLLLRYNYPQHQQQQKQQRNAAAAAADDELISPVGRRISFSSDSSSPYKPCCGSSSSNRCCSPVALLFKLVVSASTLLLQVARSVILQLLRLLLLPFVAMAVLAGHHVGVWWFMLAHGLMVQWGPWFMAHMSSSSQGLGLWFRCGLLLPLPADLAPGWIGGDPLPPAAAAAVGSSGWQQWVWLPLPDTYLISSLYACLILAPATLWVGLVVSAWHGAAAARRLDSSSSGGGGVAGAAAAAGGEVELVGAAPAVDTDTADLICQVTGDACNEHSSSGSIGGNCAQQQVVSAGSLDEYGNGASSSSGPKRVFSHSRNNSHSKHRDVGELPGTAAAGVGAASKPSGYAVASSGSSSLLHSDAAESAELEGLLPSAAATATGVTPAATAAAVLGGVTRTGSAWLINLLPLGVLPGEAAAAVAPAAAALATPIKSRPAAAAASAALSAVITTPKPRLTLATLIPTLLWYVMGIVVLLLRVIGRALQLFIVASRLPAHLLLLLLPIAYLWYKCCWRLGAAYGPVSLLVSPVVGWLPLFVLMALRHVRRQMATGRARRQE